MGMFTLKVIKISETGSIGRQLQTVVTVNGVKTSFRYEGATTRHHPVLIDTPIEDKVVKASIKVDVTELDKKYNDGPYSGTMDINVDPAAAATLDYPTPLVIPIQEVGAIGKNKGKKATLSFYFESAITCKNGANNRTTSDEGIDFITNNEGGIKNKAYQDQAKVWTIGVGHKIQLPQEKDLLTKTISDDEAKALLRQDLTTAESAVNALVKVCLTQNQFDALVDFVFQEGRGHFFTSTLRKKINSNASEAGIRAEFAKWILIGKNPSQNLIDRRKADADLYFTK